MKRVFSFSVIEEDAIIIAAIKDDCKRRGLNFSALIVKLLKEHLNGQSRNKN